MGKRYETIILGGGASGLMLSAQLTNKSSVLLIEGNTHLGAKLLVSGGGRCNVTNADMGAEFFLASAEFVSPALEAFDQHALLSWLRHRGVEAVLQKQNQYFCPDSSRQILSLLTQAIRGVDIRMDCSIQGVEHEEEGWRVRTSCGLYRAQRLVVATGGVSFPKLGASDIGYQIAASLGHTLHPSRPALVGLTLQREEAFFKELSGLSTDVTITVGDHRLEGKLLFAHKGISGPVVLDASLYWSKGTVTIDFLPGLVWHTLQQSKKQISTLLPIPRRMAKAFLHHLNLVDKVAGRLTSEEWRILKRLNAYTMAPAGTFGYARAEVTRGGIATEELWPQTMESRLHPEVYFVGEVLDVTGRLGGYNLQWAFSSAAACAREINTRSNAV